MKTLFTSLWLTASQFSSSAGRNIQLIVSLAFGVVAWAILISLSVPVQMYHISSAGFITVANVRSDGTLPLRYATLIEQMPEVEYVRYLNYLPLLCANGTTATLNGYAGNGTAAMLHERYGLDEQLIANWNADPLGILVGENLAKLCDWKVGMGLQPLDGFQQRPTEIHVAGVIHSVDSTLFANQIAIAHYEYLNRIAADAQKDQINQLTVKTKDLQETAKVAAMIDAKFASSDPPTESQQNTIVEDGLARFGKIKILLYWAIAGIFACIMLIYVSIMAHSAVNRRPIFAILYVLGFSRQCIFTSLLMETTGIVLLGLSLGLISANLVLMLLGPIVSQAIGSFVMTAHVYDMIFWISAALLACSLAFPMRLLMKLRPIDYRSV